MFSKHLAQGKVEFVLLFTQTLQSELQHGHSLLKALRERAEQAAGFLNEAGAESLGAEVEARLAQLEELAGGLRQERSFLERALLLTKEFQDRYKAQAHWLVETKALLSSPVEPKAELYQRKAQLAKYKVSKKKMTWRSFLSPIVTKNKKKEAENCAKIIYSVNEIFPSVFRPFCR